MSAINTSADSNFSVTSQITSNFDSNISEDDSATIVPSNNEQAVSTLSEENGENVEKQGAITPEQLEKVAQKLQEFVGEMNKSLEFSVDQDSGRDVIKVIDRNNGDLIKQYPTEEVLDLVSKLSEATGNLINTEV